MSDSDVTVRHTLSWRRKLRWLPFIVGVLLVAGILLGRLCWEKLFLFPLPVDREPILYEFADAAATARTWIIPALVFLFVVGIAAALTSRAGPINTFCDLAARIGRLGAERPRLVSLFALAGLFDFYTTWAYAQKFSMADELHPAIKLVAYALGITVGVAAAKAIQVALLLVVAVLWPSASRTLILVVTAGYAVAAAWNFHWL